MTEERVQRRLATILAADVVGYSRLMGRDEEATLATLKSYREAIDGLVTGHDGRIFGGAGDSVIAEFASPVEAVRSAKEIQLAIEKRNTDLPETRRMQFRIGINLGDVMIERDNLLGDGVNIAARLEGLADAGGICVSGAVHEQVRDRVDLPFEDLGERELKNIDRPIRVWRWVSGATKTAGVPANTDEALLLPDKPSIAVLPFENLSGDPEQDFLGDGLTENIISSLSKASGMLVIARNSTFTYKGKPVKVQRVADDLGVRYVLEGSVQRDGDRMRVVAQLINAVEGHHLWAETYDRKLEDLFAVQDDITQQIVVEMQVQLTEGEQARVRHRTTNNLQAWGYAARGYDLFEHYGPADNESARQLFQRALEEDPNYAWAMAMLAFTHVIDVRHGFTQDPAASLKMAEEVTSKALALDDTLPETVNLLANQAFMAGNYDEALELGRRAIALYPNGAETHAVMSNYTISVGDWDETIALGTTAVRLHPNYPPWYLFNLSKAYTFKGQYDLAIATAKEGLDRAETEFQRAGPHWTLAFAYSEAGQEEAARRHMAEGLRAFPLTAAEVRKLNLMRYRDPAHQDREIAAFVRAGMPEE